MVRHKDISVCVAKYQLAGASTQLRFPRGRDRDISPGILLCQGTTFPLGISRFATVRKSGPNFLSGSIGPPNPAFLTDRLRGGGLLLDRNWDQQTLGAPSGCYIPSIPLNTFQYFKMWNITLLQKCAWIINVCITNDYKMNPYVSTTKVNTINRILPATQKTFLSFFFNTIPSLAR